MCSRVHYSQTSYPLFSMLSYVIWLYDLFLCPVNAAVNIVVSLSHPHLIPGGLLKVVMRVYNKVIYTESYEDQAWKTGCTPWSDLRSCKIGTKWRECGNRYTGFLII